MRLPRIVWILMAAAFLLIFSSMGTYMSDMTPASTLRDPTGDPPRMLSSLDEGTAVAAAAAHAGAGAVAPSKPLASTVSQPSADHFSSPDSVLEGNSSSPGRPMSSVPQSAARGKLSAACSELPPAASSLRVSESLQFVPAVLHAAKLAGGRPGCLQPTPVCTALKHLLASSSSAAAPAAGSLGRRHQLLVTAATGAQREHIAAFTEAAAAVRVPTLILAMDEAAHAAARGTTAASVLLITNGGGGGGGGGGGSGGGDATVAGLLLARKWIALAEVLEAGAEVLYMDVDAVLASAPFGLLPADTDVAALSEGWEEMFLRGHVMGADDPSMGWSRYCESMRAALLSPSMVHLLPTQPTVALTRRMALLALKQRWASAHGAAWAAGPAEAVGLSMQLLTPAHDDTTRVGAKLRVLHASCWLHERTATSSVHRQSTRPAALLVGRGEALGGASGALCRQQSAVAHFHRADGALGDCWKLPNAMALPPAWTLERTRVDPLMSHPLQMATTKAAVLRTRCKRMLGGATAAAGAGGHAGARALNLLAPPTETVWPLAAKCKVHPDLCETVRKVHRERAVMAAVSNRNILGMLGRFVDTVQRVGVPNFLVVALDPVTASSLSPPNRFGREPHTPRWAEPDGPDGPNPTADEPNPTGRPTEPGLPRD